jgi:hypothetical protein
VRVGIYTFYIVKIEITEGKRFDRVNSYLEKTISEMEEIISTLPSDLPQSWDELNGLFLSILK